MNLRARRLRTLCKGKKPYRRLEDAAADSVKLLEQFPKVRRARVYECPVCRHFHVTTGSGWKWIWQAEREVVASA